jgi:hypothetical protein
LEHRGRSRKERKLPDVDLMTAKHNLGHYALQAERLDLAVANLESSQHRRESHLAAHSADRAELDSIDHILGDRLRQQTNRVVRDPPRYITRTLGPRPMDPTMDRTWVRAVVEIEKYRFDHNITDGRTAIGTRPRSAASVLEWYAVGNTIAEACEALAPAPRTISRPTPTVEGPSLEIGL